MRFFPTIVPALALLAVFTSATADGLVLLPATNGRFELGANGWTVGPNTAIIDGDYSGDNEAWINSTAATARLSTDTLGALALATLPVGFNVERGTLEGVTLRLALLDLRDPGNPAGELVWSFESLPQERYTMYPEAAAFPANPAWAGMTEEERAAELQNYLYAGLSFSVDAVARPALVDDFGFALGA